MIKVYIDGYEQSLEKTEQLVIGQPMGFELEKRASAFVINGNKFEGSNFIEGIVGN